MTGGKGGKGGKPAVRAAIEAAQPASSSTPPPPGPTPPAGSVPAHLAARFAMRAAGLFRISDDPTKSFWICGPFAIEAEVRDSDGGSWGMLLSWHDRDGIRHEEAFLRALFTGECTELRARLADGGLSLGATQAQRQSLSEFLNVAMSARRARSVARVGWHQIGGCAVFVLPGKTFGDLGERVILQTETREPSLFNIAGSVADWRDNIGMRCCCNSRLIFAASCAFAAPMLGMVGEDSGGFNLRGASRSGKTTILRVAASVCGGTAGSGAIGFVRQWRATGNGLESVAAAHSDSLLPLDEMSQVDGREAGEIAYMLANGMGKSRAGRSGLARPALRWRVLLLSTGEIGLAAKMAEAGGAGPKAGQEVRLADVPSDAGAGLGAFEEIHGADSADAFVRELHDLTGRFYGAPLHAFLAVLADRWRHDPAGFPEAVRERVGALVRQWLAERAEAGGQVRSVGSKFALVGIAGELATEAMLTGWQPGAAAEAAQTCFLAWLAERGTLGAREDAQAVGQLRAFILSNGPTRFDRWVDSPSTTAAQVDADTSPPSEGFRPPKRVGWRRWEAGEGGRMGWCHYLTAEGLNEALTGLAPREARRTLVAAGYLLPPTSGVDAERGNTAGLYKVPGLDGKVRLYRISPVILAAAEGAG
jgi:uncharacterized protein (DUF927 family)